jgi:hypothetical protein
LYIRESFKKLEFVSDSLSFILVGACRRVININVNVSTEDKSDGKRTAYMRSYSMCSTNKCHMNILLGLFSANIGTIC